MTNKRGEAQTQQAAGTLLGDILDANLDEHAEREALRDWVRRTLRSAKRRDAVGNDGRDALFGWLSRARIDHPARKHARTVNHRAIHLVD